MIYGSLGLAATYHTLVGNAAWASGTYSDPLRTSAMIRARRALDGRYARRFSGTKATSEQFKAWPRIGAYDICSQIEIATDVVPTGILEASYELALVELVSPNSLSPSVNVGRMTKSESVDGAASRSFFTPQELQSFGSNPLDNPFNSLRPTLIIVEDLLSCFLVTNVRWAATVV